MKKQFKKVAFSLLALLPFALVLSACGSPELTAIQVNNTDLVRTVVQNSEIDTSAIEVKATFEDGTEKVIESSDLEFSAIDTSEVGDKILTITYKGKTVEVTYKVVSDVALSYRIVDVDKPDFVAQFEQNIANTDEKSEFLLKTGYVYCVGDDNDFHFLPDISALDSSNQSVELSRYISVSKVFEKQSGSYVELTGADLTAKVAIDETNNTYNFTDAAINKEYKISVRPFNLTVAQLANVDDYTINFECKVVDGYNVHNIKEFSVFDNSKDNNKVETNFWSAYKTANGISEDVECAAIIVHGNLTVTKDELPSGYFYNASDSDINASDSDYEKCLNSLRDNVSLYNRYIDQGDSFKLYGNYFIMDASQIKLTVRDSTDSDAPSADLKGLVANTAIFNIGGVNLSTGAKALGGDYLMGACTIENMKFIGNAQITRTENPENLTGSISYVHARSEDYVNTNVITQCFKTTYFSFGNMELNYCKGYDCFNANVHVWASKIEYKDAENVTKYYESGKNNILNNCEFKNSSGPLVMLTQIGTDMEPTLVANDCVLENSVTPSDPWFSNLDSSLVTQLIQMDAFFQAKSQQLFAQDHIKKCYTGSDSALKFISVIKGSGSAGATKGIFTIKKTIDTELTVIAETNMAQTAAAQAALNNATLANAPLFRTQAGAFAYCSNTGLNTLTPSDATLAKLFEGDYLSLYTPGAARLGCILEYITTSVAVA